MRVNGAEAGASSQTVKYAELGRLLARFTIMPSNVIRHFAYHESARELEVWFVSGRRYLYHDVPPQTAGAMRETFSKGAFFNARIRDRFAFTRLEDVPPGASPHYGPAQPAADPGARQ